MGLMGPKGLQWTSNRPPMGPMGLQWVQLASNGPLKGPQWTLNGPPMGLQWGTMDLKWISNGPLMASTLWDVRSFWEESIYIYLLCYYTDNKILYVCIYIYICIVGCEESLGSVCVCCAHAQCVCVVLMLSVCVLCSCSVCVCCAHLSVLCNHMKANLRGKRTVWFKAF